jgi:hypothetical protein
MGIVGLTLFVQAYDLTGSPAALGYLGLVQFLAMLVGMLGGSAIVDHIDRRLLLLLTHSASACPSNAADREPLGDPPIALLLTSVQLFGRSLHFTRSGIYIPGGRAGRSHDDDDAFPWSERGDDRRALVGRDPHARSTSGMSALAATPPRCS